MTKIPVALIEFIGKTADSCRTDTVQVAAVFATALGLLMGELHRAGALDVEPLVDRLLRERADPATSELAHALLELIARQALAAAAAAEP